MDTRMDTRIRGVDPVTFEILSHRLHQVTREMGITLERNRRAPVNNHAAAGLHGLAYTVRTARSLCAGATLGQHVACASCAVKSIIERFPVR